MIVLCDYLFDYEGFEEVYGCACDKEKVLREFLELPCSIHLR